jgi:hypothetical protein
LKTNEEKRKAWEEKLKVNVKYMVKDLVRDDPELARTFLIIQKDNDTATNENVQNRPNSHREDVNGYVGDRSDDGDESVEENDLYESALCLFVTSSEQINTATQ